MSSWAELLDAAEPEEHVVQLYGRDDHLLTRNVTRYLSEGLKRGDGLLTIATAPHRSTITSLLRQEPGYSKAVLEGRLVFLDAQATLSRFLVDGLPDPALFRSVIGEALHGVQSHSVRRRVRAYGEMVGLLWKTGERTAALRLEELWNDLLKQSDVSLFCGYPIDIFGLDFEPGIVDPLLCAHTHLLPTGSALDTAIEHAMEDVLGARAAEVRRRIENTHRPSWAALPNAEAVLLWLRHNLSDSAEQIVTRAREHYRAAGLA